MSQQKRGRAGPKAIAAEIDRLTRPALAKRGLASSAVIAEWPAIAGDMLAVHTCPLRLTWPKGQAGDGTLHLRVSSGALATQLQHLEPLIIERVNGYFGYRAVGRLAISQGPLPKRRPRFKPPTPPADPAEVARAVAKVEDPELKEALAKLGRWVLRG